jgi:hypothetical protein
MQVSEAHPNILQLSFQENIRYKLNTIHDDLSFPFYLLFIILDGPIAESCNREE